MFLTSAQALLKEFLSAGTLWLLLFFLLTTPFIRLPVKAGRPQLGWSLNLVLAAHLLLVPLSVSLRLQGTDKLAKLAVLGYSLATLFVLITIATRLLYSRVFPKVGIQAPQIVHDLIISSVLLVGFFVLAAHAGLNVAGVIATSAVVTAVIGLALQDTLGNVIGGIVLQLDKSLDVGDWVKFGDVSGRISEISWRYTAIETRNWETVIIPNSQMMKSQVTVIGRRHDPQLRWRRWVWFQIDFRYPPTEIIQIVTKALQSADIPNVAADPPPNCVLMEFGDSVARYAVRYWLTNPQIDDPTDSEVRTHLAYALKREGIPMAMPGQTLFVKQGDPSKRGHISSRELTNRERFLCRVPLLSSLNEDERAQLAEKLISAPFLAGEIITRQGAEGHWLYILAEGKVSIRLRNGEHENEINQLEAVDFFGEMSLMTGEPRISTVVALTDVLCYRLDKESFQETIRQRPEMAEMIAGVLAERRAQRDQAYELLGEARSQHVAEDRISILAKMRRFFHIHD